MLTMRHELELATRAVTRVPRTIEKLVGNVKDTIQDAQEIWHRVRVVLTRALDPHPEAQAAVIRAIEEELLPSEA